MKDNKPKNFGKNIVFSAFLFGSLALILLSWSSEFVNLGATAPNYVRPTIAVPSPEGFEMTLEAMPTREHQPGYSGGGEGQHDDHDAELTPSPTFDVAKWTPEADLSDDLADE